MKGFVFFFLLFLLYLYVVGVEGNKFIECDIKVTCSENLTHWTDLKEIFDMLRNLKNLNSSVAIELRQRWNFCHDDRLGFLLSNETLDWSMACIWTSETKGGCLPAPGNSDPYNYIPRDEWRIMLTNVRKAAGCPEIAVRDAENSQELHICRERCIDVGMSTGGWLLFECALFSMLIGIGLQNVD